MNDEDRLLNKTELAKALGVPLTWLSQQKLPFQGGRFSVADATRILRNRQDQMKRDRIKCQLAAASEPVDDPKCQEIERRFHGILHRKG
jgi:hypothetical protein